jgi:molybdenum storage protein
MVKMREPLFTKKKTKMSKIEELANFMDGSLKEAFGNYKNDLRILPDAKVMKVGGQSITDRGRAALFPILDEVVENSKDHQIILSTGGGTRARHTYQVGIDLGMPVGVLADMGGAITVQNARMIQMLMAKHGGIYLDHLEFEKIPLFLKLGCIPIMPGMPPYSFWEDIPEHGSIPMHRTDAGAFFTAEALGAEAVYFIKDEKGLFTEDPKKNPNAEFIPEIQVDDLMAMDLGDLIVERVVLEYLKRSKFLNKIVIINGMEKGAITKTLNGEVVGTVIYS